MSNAIPIIAPPPDVPCFPVTLDPGETIPLPPPADYASPAAPFTHPKPEIVTVATGTIARIFKARGLHIVTDEDVSTMCNTSVDTINKAVLRNACMFPRAACFRLSAEEWHHMKRIAVIDPDVDRANWLTTPLAFTRDGVTALAKILNTFEIIRGSVLVWRTVENITVIHESQRNAGRNNRQAVSKAATAQSVNEAASNN